MAFWEKWSYIVTLGRSTDMRNGIAWTIIWSMYFGWVLIVYTQHKEEGSTLRLSIVIRRIVFLAAQATVEILTVLWNAYYKRTKSYKESRRARK